MSNSQTALAWHLTFRLHDERVLAASPAEHRAVARAVWDRLLADRVLSFRVAGDHLHVLAVGSRRDAGRLAHHLACALRYRLDLPGPFEPARIRPIEDRRHLLNAFRYVASQQQRHGLDLDPLHEGGTLLDLMGLRVAGRSSRPLLRRMLPEAGRDEFLALFRKGLDVPESAFDPAAPLAADAVDRLLEATASAACLRDLRGRAPAVLAARAAAVHVAEPWVDGPRLRELLGRSRKRVAAFARHDRDPELIDAIRRQLHLRAHLPADLGSSVVGGSDAPAVAAA